MPETRSGIPWVVAQALTLTVPPCSSAIGSARDREVEARAFAVQPAFGTAAMKTLEYTRQLIRESAPPGISDRETDFSAFQGLDRYLGLARWSVAQRVGQQV